MKELTLAEVKQLETNILVYLDSFCKENNIEYSVCGGTALGAVRHKGFIPWDDDIDILMKREDYERFLKLYKEKSTSKYQLIDDTDSGYQYLYAKVYDPDTSIVDDNVNRYKLDLGVFVDVFPIDYVGNDIKQAEKNISKTKFNRALLTASNWSRFFINKNHGKGRQFIRFIFFILSRFTNPNNIKKRIYKKYDKLYSHKQNFSANACTPYGKREIMPTELFESFSDIEFEGHKVRILKDYDLYLKSLFHNYMQLPPEDKRVANHTYKFFKK